MASLLAKFIANKVLGETAKNRFGKDDPYFERVPATELNGQPSKKIKRQPKAFPPGISEHDKKVLTKARRRAYILDLGYNICGIRFGMSSLIGLVPAIGDFLDLFMALMVIRTCQKIDDGLPSAVKSKMVMNVIVDFFVGLVPFLGDLADAVFRCNTRNVVLLEKHLVEKGAKNLAGDPYPASRPHAAAAAAAQEDEVRFQYQAGNPPAYEARPNVSTTDPYRSAPREPEPVRVRQDGRPAVDRGWFSFGSQRPAPHDVERGGGGGTYSTRR